MIVVRPPAVAGQFYPGEAEALRRTVRRLLAGAAAAEQWTPPKAAIAPHAGYVYSGAVAASAYARIAPLRGRVSRVVVMGPAHRVALRGFAASSARAFATPLGEVPVDAVATARLLALPGVGLLDIAHEAEHSIEVQLPFLQEVLGQVSVVPILAGRAEPEEVAQVLEALWEGPETLIVVSSDLSHYLDYDRARKFDAATTQAIERLRPTDIGADQACGRVPIGGLLTLARRRGMTCLTVDLRNSGDTAGGRDRVVGYGAYLFFEGADPERLRAEHGETLLELASTSIEHGLDHGRPAQVSPGEFAPELAAFAATFVTLKADGRLRGCMGSPEAWRPVVEDVADNAYRAAFLDNRFPPLTRAEWPSVALSLSILSPPEPMRFASERDLARQLRPGLDGVILAEGGRRGVFLPSVWTELSDPAAFLRHLKRKAGLSEDYWSGEIKAYRFTAMSISRAGPPKIG